MVGWEKYLECRVHQAEKKVKTVALLQSGGENGTGNTGKEFSQSAGVVAGRGTTGEEFGTLGRGEFSTVGISLLKPAAFIYWQGLTWFGLLTFPATWCLKHFSSLLVMQSTVSMITRSKIFKVTSFCSFSFLISLPSPFYSVRE